MCPREKCVNLGVSLMYEYLRAFQNKNKKTTSLAFIVSIEFLLIHHFI